MLQRMSDSEAWEDINKVYASINKTTGSTYLGSGSEQTSATKTFEMRYAPFMEEIQFNIQNYRIIYKDNIYMLKDYDDYMERHVNVRVIAES
ncbi:MAG: head-tail adaptor protein, partial [Eubacteriales bacterium]